ncbi:MAG: hypothetical protein JSS09_08960 [Verrucomicrobia bacterium]|nr:hypothetical protein [Verrucomicrobiota bacterium]
MLKSTSISSPPTPEKFAIITRSLEKTPLNQKVASKSKEMIKQTGKIFLKHAQNLGLNDTSAQEFLEEKSRKIFTRVQILEDDPEKSNDAGVKKLIQSPWYRIGLDNLYRTTEKAYPSSTLPHFIDKKHISTTDSSHEKNTGFHIFPSSTDPIVQAMTEMQFSPNGSISAKWSQNSKIPSKFSTFFDPSKIPGPRHLISQLNSAKRLPYFHKNLHLLKLGNGIIAEARETENLAPVYQTIYPIFRFISSEELKSEESFQITSPSTIAGKSNAVFLKSRKNLEDAIISSLTNHSKAPTHHKYCPIRYVNDEAIIIDIAQELRVEVHSGIYVEVPQKKLSSLLGEDFDIKSCIP